MIAKRTVFYTVFLCEMHADHLLAVRPAEARRLVLAPTALSGLVGASDTQQLGGRPHMFRVILLHNTRCIFYFIEQRLATASRDKNYALNTTTLPHQPACTALKY